MVEVVKLRVFPHEIFYAFELAQLLMIGLVEVKVFSQILLYDALVAIVDN
jgi:hypothetical protein